MPTFHAKRSRFFFLNLLKQISSVALFQFYSEGALEKIITKLTCLEKQDIMLWSPSSYWTLHSQNLFCISLILSKIRVILQFYEKGRKKISSVCMHSCNVSGNFHFRFSFLHEVKGIMCKMRCSCQRGINESQKKRLLWENVVTSVKNTSHMTFTVCILYLLCVFIVFINELYVLMNLFILIYRIRNCLSFSYKIILLWIFF